MKLRPRSALGNNGNALSQFVSPSKLVEALAETLPPVFCRADIDRLMCGVISSRTQANLDSAGKGPNSNRTKSKVLYLKDDYVPWLIEYLRARWIDAPKLDTV